MEAYRRLFERLTIDYIKAEMLGQEFENNWLECKEKQRADRHDVDQGDKSVFAKALSGFANTSGLYFPLTFYQSRAGNFVKLW